MQVVLYLFDLKVVDNAAIQLVVLPFSISARYINVGNFLAGLLLLFPLV